MDLSPEIEKPLKRFFNQFAKQLCADTQVLVSQQVESSLREVKLLRGTEEIDPVFETEWVIAFVREDGKDLGDLHLLFSVRSAIAFTGLMMMMPLGPLAEKVRLLAFDDTLQEAFQEIGNISVGALNGLVEKEIEKGHLFMDGTAFITDDSGRPAAVAGDTYVHVAAEIAIGDFGREPFHILVSQGLAETLGGAPLIRAEDPGASPEGSELAALMVDPARSADESDTVSHAIAMMEKDGAKQIGVLRNGALIRVITRGDLRQLMGPFYGTNAMSARDKAVLNLQLGKISKKQQLVSIPATGSMKEAVELIIENDLRSLPVVDDEGALVGFIPTRELMMRLHKSLH